jgi:hypothetical protein
MNKFEEWVNDFTIMGDDGAVIFSSYDQFLEFIEEIVVDERKREREACAVVCENIEHMTPEFNEWWDAGDLLAENPYSPETPIYWAWEGWQAARKREWVGLTDDEVFNIYKQFDSLQYKSFAKAIEAKLKEKNT